MCPPSANIMTLYTSLLPCILINILMPDAILINSNKNLQPKTKTHHQPSPTSHQTYSTSVGHEKSKKSVSISVSKLSTPERYSIRAIGAGVDVVNSAGNDTAHLADVRNARACAASTGPFADVLRAAASFSLSAESASKQYPSSGVVRKC